MLFAEPFTIDDPSTTALVLEQSSRVEHNFEPGELCQLFQPLNVLYYGESRYAAPESTCDHRAWVTLIIRRFFDH
jgi:hypothetical protein